jgi:hypothetical protein
MNLEEKNIWNLGVENYKFQKYTEASQYFLKLSSKFKMASVLIEHIEEFKNDPRSSGIWNFTHK